MINELFWNLIPGLFYQLYLNFIHIIWVFEGALLLGPDNNNFSVSLLFPPEQF